MKAIVLRGTGGPEVLRLEERGDPRPAHAEVVVRVRATAMNRADLLQRRGSYPAPPGAPVDIPGLEFAGEVETPGAGVDDLRPGDRVMGLLAGGGHAERVAVHHGLCLPIPQRLSWEEAAAIPEAFLTSFDALVLQGRLATGEQVLIHAASSGVGTASLQIVREWGASAIALSRSASKRRRLADLGAVHAFDAAAADLAGRIRDASGGRGVGLVLDLVGASGWPLNLEVLSERGRIVVVGLLAGSRIGLDLGRLMRARATVIGTVLRGRSLAEKTDLVRRFREDVLPALAAGRLRPVVDRVLPLAEAAEAHRSMERNEHFGKIVLRV